MPDYCFLKAIMLMKEAEMDGPKQEAPCWVGSCLMQTSSKEPKGPQDPRHPRADSAHLDAVQQLAHAPEAVGFNAAQHILRQIGHVEVLHILFCKTKGGESPEVFSKK